VTAALALLFGGLGAIVGSFLNVVIHRLPRAEPMRLMGRSQCPSCRAVIAWFDNLPLLSYLLLLGRCRRCRWPIPIRYPAVEALGSGLFAVALLRGDTLGWSPLLAGAGLVSAFLAALVAASFIDLRHRTLPDLLTLKVALPIATLAAVAVPAIHGTSLWGVSLAGAGKPGLASLLVGMAGSAAGAGAVLLVRSVALRLTRRASMVAGDAKLMAACGMLVGPQGALVAIALALLVGGTLRLVLRGRAPPYGPLLAAGATATLLVGPALRLL